MIECGVAWFALPEDGWEAQSEEALRAEDVPAARLGLDDAAASFRASTERGSRSSCTSPRRASCGPATRSTR